MRGQAGVEKKPVRDRLQKYLLTKDPKERAALLARTVALVDEIGQTFLPGLRRAVAEGQEAALLYNPVAEIFRLHRKKEITQEQYDSNPLKKAYDEYASSIPYRVADLSIVFITEAVTATKKPPAYRPSVDLALKKAAEHIARICKEVGCNATTAAIITRELVRYICGTAYYVYYPEESAAFEEYLKAWQQKKAEIMAQVQEPVTDTKNDPYYQEKERLDKELDEKARAFNANIYKDDQADRIAAGIVSGIYPGEAYPSIERADRDLSAPGAYFSLPSTSTTYLTKRILNNPGRLASTRRGRIKQTEHYLTQDSIIKYKGADSDLTITLERTKELFTKKIQNGAKVFNFLLQKLNEQNRIETTSFQLSELVTNGIYANKDSAFRGLNNVLGKIYSISIEGIAAEYSGSKKQDRAFAKSRIISFFKVSYTDCFVSITPIIRENIPYITLLPRWSYRLNENSFMVADYIFYLARQNAAKIKEQGFFNISLDAIRIHLGLPSIAEAGHRLTQLIVEPIEKAITEIEEARRGTDIKITPYYNPNYKNVSEYLTGYLKIELDEAAQTYMEERAIAQESEKKREAKRIAAKTQPNGPPI